ncbi:MAG: class I SAM-dependent methyltransferase, partial [Gemmatimonadales bacterium]
QAGSGVRLLGFEPADEMRAHAASNVRDLPSVEVRNGRFESIPLESDSVDYLYSLIAFHWATDLEASVRELARVLKPGGEMDLYFVGRDSGKNFIQRTSPILMKHLGLGWLVKSAKIRKHLGRKDSEELFQSVFPTDRLVVDESHEVHFDSLEGHWNWWQARLEPHFIDMSPEKRKACDQEMLASLAELETDEGVPFDVHLIHVHLDGVSESA